MQAFDVYLKKRLTEIDVIITQLVQRDSFSIYDWLYIYATLDDIEVRKSLKVNTSMTLDTMLDDILEIVAEKIHNELYVDVDMDLVNQVITGGETEMVLSASELDTIEKSFTGGDSSLEIAVDPLDYYIAHSFGKVEFDMKLLVNELDTLKYSFEKIVADMELSADIDFASIKNIGLDESEMFLDVDPMNIFYLLTIAGKAITYMSASPIEKYILKKVLYGVESEMYLSANTDTDWQLQKFIGIDNSLNLLADMTEVLIQFVSGQSEMYLNCEASAGLKRYRLLHEMDNLTLSDFDDMTLEEVDYVIIAE